MGDFKLKNLKFILMYVCTIIISLSLSLCVSNNFAAAKTKKIVQEQTLSKKQKVEDLNILCESLEKNHKNLFAFVSKEDFYKQKQKIVKKIPKLSDQEFYFELKHLVAMAGDAHTRIGFQSSNTSMNQIPFKVEEFSDGYYITSIDSKYKKYLGYKLISINGNKLNDIYDKLTDYISHENKAWLNIQLQNEIVNADLLNYLGIIDDTSEIPCIVANKKNTIKVNLTSYKGQFPKIESIKTKPNKTFYKSNRIYHFEDLNNETFYIQYNSCEEDKNLPIADFAKQIEEKLATKNYKKVIIDLRYNTGGNSMVFTPVITKVMQAKKQYKLDLYTLISNTTFSSGLINAIDFMNIGAVLVGEPTGGNVVSYGDIQSFKLPNSSFQVTYSTKYFELIPGYKKDSLYPDVEIKTDFSEYKNGIDSCVKAILEETNPIKKAVGKIKPYTLEEKKTDLEFLCNQLEKSHKNLFHTISKEEFNLQKKEILEKIDNLNDIEFFLELMRLCSMVKDNATQIQVNNKIWNELSFLPFLIEKFEDGWYLTAIDKQYENYLGYQLTAINDREIEEIYQKVSTILSSQKRDSFETEFPTIIYIADFLKYFDFIDTISTVKLTVEKNGKQTELVLESTVVNGFYMNLVSNNIQMPDTYPENQWYRFMDLQDKTFFIQYNVCQEDSAYSIEAFAQEIEQKIEKGNYENVIVDLRYNSGENSAMFEPVITKLAQLQKKKSLPLYTLIGLYTSPAILKNALDLKEIGAITVGRGTIEEINYYGAAETFVLPNTNFLVACPTESFSLLQEKESFCPDIEIKHTFKDYIEGKDSEVESIQKRLP